MNDAKAQAERARREMQHIQMALLHVSDGDYGRGAEVDADREMRLGNYEAARRAYYRSSDFMMSTIKELRYIIPAQAKPTQ